MLKLEVLFIDKNTLSKYQKYQKPKKLFISEKFSKDFFHRKVQQNLLKPGSQNGRNIRIPEIRLNATHIPKNSLSGVEVAGQKAEV
jgi:hypothetical protein